MSAMPKNAVRPTAGGDSQPTGFEILQKLYSEYAKTRRLGTLVKWEKEFTSVLQSLVSDSTDTKTTLEAAKILGAFRVSTELVRGTVALARPI